MSQPLPKLVIYRRAARTFAGLFGGQAVNVAYQLISVPLLLSHLGTDRYAAWLLLLTIPAYLSLSDFGVASVAANEMAMLDARGERDLCVRIYRGMWTGLAVVSCVTAGLAVAAVVLLGRVDIAVLAALSSTELQASLLLLLAITTLAQAHGIALAGFRVAGSFSLGLQLLNLGRLGELGMLVWSAMNGASFVGLIGAMAVARLVTLGMCYLLLRVRVPWLQHRLDIGALGAVTRLVPNGVLFLAFPLGHAALSQGVTWLVALELGSAVVVQVATVRLVANLGRQAIGLVGNSFWPEISAAFGAGDSDRLHRLVRTGFWLSVTASLGVAALLSLGGSALLAWWVPGASVPPQLLQFIVLAMLLDSMWVFPLIVSAAVNRHRAVALWFVAVSAAAFVSAGFLLPRLGVNAIPVVLGATGAAMTVVSIAAVSRGVLQTGMLSVVLGK